MVKEDKPKLGKLREDGQPALGMKFEQSREKLLKFKTSRANPYLKESMINQVKLHEGESAATELRKEINFKYDEENKVKPMDFIHNPKGKLFSRGWDSGKTKTIAWCPECAERCYVYTVIGDGAGNSVYRCGRCGSNCIEITEVDYKSKQEEGNG